MRPGPRKPTTWTPDTCPTPKGTTPKHKVGRPKGSRSLGPPKGAPELLPRGTIIGIIRHLAQHEPERFAGALRRGLDAKGAASYPYFAIAAAYLDGKPIERIQVQGDHRLLFVPMPGRPAAELPGSDLPLLPDVGGPDDPQS